jgi:methylmalonyl-CoA epimerase
LICEGSEKRILSEISGPNSGALQIVQGIHYGFYGGGEEEAMIRKIDHVGIVVRDLDKAVKTYKDLYGLSPIKIETLEDVKARIAFIPVGEVLIELLEPTAPGSGRIGRFLEENGEGFHHIALRVEDIDLAMRRFKQMNLALRDKSPRNGADDSRIAFIEPEVTQHVLTELVERQSEVKEG